MDANGVRLGDKTMYRTYEIFEVLPDGTPKRFNVVSGLEFARLALQELARRTNNECFAADAKTHQLVMQMNIPQQKWQTVKHIFQIAYDEEREVRRAGLLKARGYDVISVLGNEAAKIALSTVLNLQLFIIGHAALSETRREMVDWLKTHYPTVKILAINPPNQKVLFGADFNVRVSDSQRWLRVAIQKLETFPILPSARAASPGRA